MVQFNPDVKEQQLPHYWYWSKPLEKQNFAAPEGNRIAVNIEPDKSKGIALSGIGDILASGMKAADSVVDSSARFEADQASREERARRSAELSGASDSLISGDRPDQGKINEALAPLNILKNARANGHLSDTDYWMRVDARLSDIRSRYPVAYRDDIDQTSTRILGENAANAVVRSQTADINASLAAAKAEQNKLISRLDRANDDGIQHAEDWKKAVLSGHMTQEQAERNISEAYQPFYRQKLLDAKVKELQAQGLITDGNKLSLDAFDSRVRTSAEENWKHYDQTTGMTQKKADGVTLTAQEAQQRYEVVKQHEAEYRHRVQELATEPRPELGGRSYLQVHGQAEVDKIVEANAGHFKVEADILSNPNYGYIYRGRKLIDAAHSDFAERAFGADSLRDYELKYNYSNKSLGPDAAKYWETQEAGKLPQMHQDLKNLDTTLRYGAKPGDPPRTVQKSYEDLAKSKTATPELYSSVAHTIVNVGMDPKVTPEARSRSYDSAFDPTNQGFIGILQKPSQLPMYNLFTNKGFTENVKNEGTAKQNSNMVDWTRTSFSNMVSGDIKDLADIQDISGIKIQWYKPDERHPPRLGFTLGSNRNDAMSSGDFATQADAEGNIRGTAVSVTKANQIRETLSKINQGVVGLHNVYVGKNSPDVEATIFQALERSGFKPNAEKVENLPQAISAAIQAARKQKEDAAASGEATQKKVKELEGGK